MIQKHILLLLCLMLLFSRVNSQANQQFMRLSRQKDQGNIAKINLRNKIRSGIEQAIQKQFGSLFSKTYDSGSSINNFSNQHQIKDIQNNVLNQLSGWTIQPSQNNAQNIETNTQTINNIPNHNILPNSQLNNQPYITSYPILPTENTNIVTSITTQPTIINNNIVSQPIQITQPTLPSFPEVQIINPNQHELIINPIDFNTLNLQLNLPNQQQLPSIQHVQPSIINNVGTNQQITVSQGQSSSPQAISLQSIMSQQIPFTTISAPVASIPLKNSESQNLQPFVFNFSEPLITTTNGNQLQIPPKITSQLNFTLQSSPPKSNTQYHFPTLQNQVVQLPSPQTIHQPLTIASYNQNKTILPNTISNQPSNKQHTLFQLIKPAPSIKIEHIQPLNFNIDFDKISSQIFSPTQTTSAQVK